MSGKHVKDLFSQTTIYGIGLTANKLLSVVLLPLYTYFYNPSDLGAYNIVQSVWLILIIGYLYGQETSFIKFFIDEKLLNNKIVVYSTTLIMLIVSSLLFSSLLYFLSPVIASLIRFDNPEQGLYLVKLLAIVLFTDSLFRFPLLLLRAELRAKEYLAMTLLSIFVNIICNFYLIAILKVGIASIFYSYIISVIVTFIAGFIITKKYFRFIFNLNTAIDLVKYGNKFIYIGVFLLLIDLSDRFFLKYFFNEEAVGIYSANYKLASVMALVITAFRFSWTPYFLNLENNPENKKIISNIFTYLVAGGMLLFLFFALFTEPIVNIKFGKYTILDVRYQSGLVILPYILMAYFFSGIYSALTVAPFYANRTYELFYISLGGFALNIILNFALIPPLRLTGAALATLLTYFIMFIFLWYRSQNIYKINFEYKKILSLFFISVLFFMIGHFIKYHHSYTIFIIYSASSIIFYIIFLKIFLVIKLTTVFTIFKKST